MGRQDLMYHTRKLLKDYQSNLQSTRMQSNTLTTHETLNYYFQLSSFSLNGPAFVDFNYWDENGSRRKREICSKSRLATEQMEWRNIVRKENCASCRGQSSGKVYLQLRSWSRRLLLLMLSISNTINLRTPPADAFNPGDKFPRLQRQPPKELRQVFVRRGKNLN